MYVKLKTKYSLFLKKKQCLCKLFKIILVFFIHHEHKAEALKP